LWSFFLLTQAGLAQSPKTGAIDALLKPFVEAGHFSGVVLAVENGRLIYEKPLVWRMPSSGFPIKSTPGSASLRSPNPCRR